MALNSEVVVITLPEISPLIDIHLHVYESKSALK